MPSAAPVVSVYSAPPTEASTVRQSQGDGVARDEATESVLDRLAREAVGRYALPPDTRPTLVNLSENATYRLDDPSTGGRWALRIHRPGYHSHAAIASELAWLTAVETARAAIVPTPIAGRDGTLIQRIATPDGAAVRHAVLFAWESGREPAPGDVAGFEQLGETAARMHRLAASWRPPAWFERPTWSFETSLGARPHWGRWRDGMGMTPEIEAVLAQTVAVIAGRLAAVGTGPAVFGLVHGDMRHANLLVDGDTVKVIDFDDCGFSWRLYDCATTVSFMEDAPEAPDLIAAWVRGYRRFAALSAEEEAEIATFVMLRRILLVAWIGSHCETGLARAMGVAYTEATVPLCERYLSRFAPRRAA